MPGTEEAEIKAKLEILRKLRDGETALEDCPFCGTPSWYSAKSGKVLLIRGGCESDCAGAMILLVGEDAKGWQSAIDRWNRRA